MRSLRTLLVVLALGLAGALPLVAHAQTATAPRSTGAIEGAVFLDDDGDGLFDVDEAGVAGVTVRLSGNGLERTAASNESGLYRFAGLPDGTYTVTVAPEPPYEIADREDYAGLEVSGDNLASVDFALRRSDQTGTQVDQAPPSATPTRVATRTGTPAATRTSATGTATVVATALPTDTASPPPSHTATLWPTVIPEWTLSPPTPIPPGPPAGKAQAMPETGFDDLGTNAVLALALATLALLAGLGWALERRS